MAEAYVDFAIPADTSRGPSPNVWLGAPDLSNLVRFGDCLTDGDDFPYFSADGNRYNLIQADSGSSIAQLSSAGELGGILRGTTGATDENEFYISGGTGIGPCAEIGVGLGDVWFETRVRPSQISDFCWFAGLTVPTWAAANEITDATGALADHSYIGFRVLANALTYIDAVYNTASGGGETVFKNDAQLLVAATWYKLGIRYDDSQKKIYFFINGTNLDPAGVAPTATNFPNNIPVTWSMGGKSVTGTTGLLDCDWWRCIHRLTLR
jgi:hypothetical protein